MEVAWEGNNEKFIAKKRGKIDSIISEFISHYIWNSEEEKTNFFNLDFLNDNKSLNILFSIANKVLEEKNKQNVV
jgi:hypothetical protein